MDIHTSWYDKKSSNKMHQLLCLLLLCSSQGLTSPRWQQLASRPLSVSSGLRFPEEPLARADAIFKVTMLPGDGVGPELMTAVKDVFKVCSTVMEME